MIGKAGSGSSFGGLSSYLEQDSKMEFKEAHNLASDDPEHYVAAMEDTASMSKAEQPVYHVSLSYHEADAPGREQMIGDGKQMLEKLGLDEHQAIFVAHRDTDHPHLHLMVNRVHPETGNAWNTYRDHYRTRAVCRELEHQHGYVATREKNPEKHLELSNGEYHQIKDNGLEKMPLKAKAEFYELDKVFDQAKGWADLRESLSEVGMEVKRKGRGGVLKDLQSGQTMKLSRIDSSIGRNQSLGRLEKRFGKRKEFEKVLEANKELGKHLPNQEVRESFQRLSRSKFGSNSFQKSAKEGFEKAVSGSFNLEKTAEGLKTLAKSANPVSGAAKVGFKIAKAAIKQITKSITISY